MIIVAAMLGPVASAGCERLTNRGRRHLYGKTVHGKTESDDGDSIVGFWRVNLVSKDIRAYPMATVLDAGYSQWHSDGTEILNSSRAPETRVFCLGCGRKSHRSTTD